MEIQHASLGLMASNAEVTSRACSWRWSSRNSIKPIFPPCCGIWSMASLDISWWSSWPHRVWSCHWAARLSGFSFRLQWPAWHLPLGTNFELTGFNPKKRGCHLDSNLPDAAIGSDLFCKEIHSQCAWVCLEMGCTPQISNIMIIRWNRGQSLLS